MTNELTLERKSNLVMPVHYTELDSEEMSYVEGGLYLSYSLMNSFVVASGKAGANVWGSVGAMLAPTVAALGGLKSALFSALSAIAAWFNSIPVVGQIICLWALANAAYLVGSMVSAYVQKKGVDVSIKWKWFIPYVSTKIC